MAKRPPAPEQERENAYICLYCDKPECTGADSCYREQKKLRQKQYQAARRSAERSLDKFYNEMQSKEQRRRRYEAQQAFHRKKDAE